MRGEITEAEWKEYAALGEEDEENEYAVEEEEGEQEEGQEEGEGEQGNESQLSTSSLPSRPYIISLSHTRSQASFRERREMRRLVGTRKE